MIHSPPATLGIVLFGTRYLADVVPTLLALDYPVLKIALFDQEAPYFSASAWLQKHAPALLADPRVMLTTGPNLWHSGGHNFLIRQSLANGSEIYFAGSNDIWYASDVLAKLAEAFIHDAKLGSVQPKLKSWQPDASESRTSILDSTGLIATRGQHFADRGQGELDRGQYDKSITIFGASAALAGYRLAALQSVATRAATGALDFFDPALHYKNDVDLAYRLAWAGWHAAFVPTAEAWHARQLGTRQPLCSSARLNSFFGQIALLFKNFTLKFGVSIFLATFAQLFLRIIFMLFTQPFATMRQLQKFWRLRGELWARRAPRLVSPAALAKLLRCRR